MLQSIDAARRSLRQHRWDEATALFSESDQAEPLGPDDLVQYAAAAWWSGDVETSTDTLERAFSGFETAGDPAGAAVVALRLARLAMLSLRPSVMAGWIARAQRLLQGRPESSAHAWLRLMTAAVAGFMEGDLERADELAKEALRLAREHGNPDVESLALAFRGQFLARQGLWREGLALVEEAAAAASAGVEALVSCDVYCLTISALADLGEYDRAGEWIDEADRWMRTRSINGYRGECRVHRAELKRLHGDWLEAETEAREACVELERFRMLEPIGIAYYQIGEVRLRLGDLELAGEAFQRAVEHGHPAQPGLALLALAKGRRSEATSMVSAGSSDAEGEAAKTPDLLVRARLASAAVEIALANEDLPTAERAASELERVAERYSSNVMSGLASTATGAVSLRQGRWEAATDSLRRAARLWKDLRMPYEWARARTLLGEALLQARDWPRARLELQAARHEFERLGAAPDIARVDELLHGSTETPTIPGVTKTFMFTDIVSSTDLAGSLGDNRWRRALAQHDRTVRAAIARHGGVEVRHTGDGFFITFDEARSALECAVEIQRQLEADRREGGSELGVRIGLHRAHALPREGDYSGQAVHLAARVAALAERGEVLASQEAVEGAGIASASPADRDGLALSEPRMVRVKGVGEPVVVRTVLWT